MDVKESQELENLQKANKKLMEDSTALKVIFCHKISYKRKQYIDIDIQIFLSNRLFKLFNLQQELRDKFQILSREFAQEQKRSENLEVEANKVGLHFCAILHFLIGSMTPHHVFFYVLPRVFSCLF